MTWRILVVDDEGDIAEMAVELLNSQSEVSVQASFEKSFEKSLPAIIDGKFDMLVLDVRNQSFSRERTLIDGEETSTDGDEDPGLGIFDLIRSQKFLPIVFYTALPNLVESLSNPPFVQVVSKIYEDHVARLRDAVAIIVDSGLLNITSALDRHVTNVTRHFMTNFVENNWSAFRGYEADLAHLLLRRLSVSLEEEAAAFVDELGYSSGSDTADRVHATRCYVVPPTNDYRMGDIVKGRCVSSQDTDNSDDFWYVILTPSCDLVRDRVKAEEVVMSECIPLSEFSEYGDWVREETDAAKRRLENLLRSRPDRGQLDRYHYLPAAWQIPDLLVDLQRILHIPYAQLDEYTKMASLDSPFSEALINRFNRYIGRIGTPDLDVDAALDRMREATD